MDALLQEAANDVFNDTDGSLYASAPANDHSNNDNSQGDQPRPKLSAMEVLQQSAAVIVNEDKYELKKALSQEVEELAPVVEELKQAIKHRNDENYEDDTYDDNDHQIVTKEVLATAKTEDLQEKAHTVTKKVGSDDEDEEDDVYETNSDTNDDDIDPEAKARAFELLLACHKGDDLAVAVLIKKKVSLYSRDRHGWSVVHWAAAKGHDKILEDILRACDRPKYLVNLADTISGWTPMHVACIGGHPRAVAVLLKYGASKKKKNKLKEKPIDCILSSDKNYSVIIKLLQ